MLYNPDRHLPPISIPWNQDKVEKTIALILKNVLSRQEANGFWKAHPDEDGTNEFNHTLYLGSAGSLWGLLQISEYLNEPLPFDPALLVNKIHKAYLEKPDTGEISPSYLAGETGILLLKYKLTPSVELKDKITELIRKNIHHPANEMLFGNPGTMLAALHLGERELFQECSQPLIKDWTELHNGIWYWQQTFGDRKIIYTGAAHGTAGNIHALLSGIDFLAEEQKTILLSRASTTIINSATEEDGNVNWPIYFDEKSSSQFNQWCHGAAGIVTSLHSFPINFSAKLESVLEKSGELIWSSGPLKKGVGICHGTDGNGFAFLNLYKRTKKEIWLERARSFAMYALNQMNERSTLWTGEVGLALYLIACLEVDDRFPCLDYF